MMKNMMSNVWGYIAEPRRITAAMTVAYLLLAIQGFWNFATPQIEGLTVEPVRISVNLMLITSGLLGAICSMKGLWLFERPAILLVATAYFVHLVWSACDLDGDGVIEQGRIVRILLVMILFYCRYMHIRDFLVEPPRRHGGSP